MADAASERVGRAIADTEAEVARLVAEQMAEKERQWRLNEANTATLLRAAESGPDGGAGGGGGFSGGIVGSAAPAPKTRKVTSLVHSGAQSDDMPFLTVRFVNYLAGP